jgi:hypothetical protein
MPYVKAPAKLRDVLVSRPCKSAVFLRFTRGRLAAPGGNAWPGESLVSCLGLLARYVRETRPGKTF